MAFEKLCDELHMFTDRIVISFLDSYRKIAKNIKALGIKELNREDMMTIAERFSDIAKQYGLRIETCAEQIDLKQFGIRHSRCIDGELIEKIVGCKISSKDIRDDNRENCGCMKCIDIGQYDTCIHNCLYCYANITKYKAIENHKTHLPMSPLMSGEFDITKVKIRNEKDMRSFKILQEQLTGWA
jgi:hypothetical protein